MNITNHCFNFHTTRAGAVGSLSRAKVALYIDNLPYTSDDPDCDVIVTLYNPTETPKTVKFIRSALDDPVYTTIALDPHSFADDRILPRTVVATPFDAIDIAGDKCLLVCKCVFRERYRQKVRDSGNPNHVYVDQTRVQRMFHSLGF